MWTIIKTSLLSLLQVHPETVIHLAGGYARVKLSPVEYRRVVK